MKHLFTLKSLLLTLVMLCGLNAWGETYQHVFTSKPSTGNNVTLSGMSWTITAKSLNGYQSAYAGVQIGAKTTAGSIKLTSSSDWNYNGLTEITEVRLWLNTGGSNNVTSSVKIGDVEVASDEVEVVKNSSASTWADATKVTFKPSEALPGVIEINVATDGNKAGYICAVEIDCQAGAAAVVEKPTFSLASGTYYGPQEVTIQIPDGAKRVMYTTDDTDPSVNGVSITVNTPITVSKTTTIKAIAVDDSDNKSAVASATYTILPSIANTKETALTTKGAKTLIDATSAEQLAAEKVYVKGVISQIDKFNSTYGSITYWLDDNAFEVYSGLGMDGAQFTAIDNIVVGASVIVYGNVKKYNSTYEFDKNNYLVEYTEPASTQSIAINGNATKTEYEAGETFSTQGLEVVATLTDGSTLDVTSAAAWTIEPETLTVETTTVKVTAEYDGFSASKDVAVTVVAAAPSVTLDLTTTAQIKGKPTEDLLEYDANVLTVSSEKNESTTAANSYYGGDAGNHTSTRFYKGSIVTFTPAANFEIVSITYNATTEGYATALANSTWTNASATVEDYTVTVASTTCYPVTIVPTDGTKPFEATIGATTGAKSMVIKYSETPIATEEGLDAVLLGEVGKKYQINATLRVNYKDANYVYASTTEGGCTKTAPTEAQKEEWWSDKAADFNQNDWVAIQGLVDVQVGAEIEAGSVATLVSNDAFPVVEFVTESHTTGTAIDANTYRVANFDSDNELVKKLWLVDPQPAEHCFVKGYVASLDDVVEIDGVFVAEIKSGEKDVVTMLVNYNPTDFSITATGWYRFEGVVVNGTSGLELNAVNVNEGTATGVEGVETSSVKVYGAKGVINVESEEVAPIAVYSANGAIVSSVEASSASIAVAPGFYIVKAGNSVSKVTVK